MSSKAVAMKYFVRKITMKSFAKFIEKHQQCSPGFN